MLNDFKKLQEKDDCAGNGMDILQKDIQHGRPKLVEEMYDVWGCIEYAMVLVNRMENN